MTNTASMARTDSATSTVVPTIETTVDDETGTTSPVSAIETQAAVDESEMADEEDDESEPVVLQDSPG